MSRYITEKLHKIGLSKSTVYWFASYLSGRQQAVLDKNKNPSTFISLNTGVPQGSVLGPLLFSLYVNDISVGFDPTVFHLIYADDLQMYVQFPQKELQRYLDLMSRHAEYVLSWATLNNLRLNVAKTKAMLFGSSYYLDLISNVAYSGIVLDHTTINFESSVRSLGVMLDPTLSWKNQINNVCKKANTLLYRLNYFRKSTNFGLRKHLIETLLFPLVDHCCLVYCDITAELDLKLQRVINSGIRYIFGLKKSEHITPHRQSLGWLTTAGRRNYFAASLLHKLFYTHNPRYLYDRYLWNESERPVRGVRGDRPPLVVPSYSFSFLYRTFFVISTIIWNNVPERIRSCITTTTFKSSILAHYLSLENNSSSYLQSHF